MARKSKRKKNRFQRSGKTLFYWIAGVIVGLSILLISLYSFRTNNVLEKPFDIRSLRRQLILTTNTQSPKEALQLLSDKLMDDKVANECHGLSHTIGNVAYIKYKDVSQALSFNNEMCGAGYMHGVVEARFADFKDDSEVYQVLSTICAPKQSGMCYHGIGHGFMWYSSNDIYRALSSCDSLQMPYQKNNCYDGVFMENFEGDNLHKTNFLNSQNPAYPCNQLNFQYKESCYFYSPRYYTKLYPEKYFDAFEWCRTLEPGFQLTCIKGVGSAVMKQHLNEPEMVASFCDQTKNNDEKIYCLDGMVSYYLVNYQSIQKGLAMCRQLSHEDVEYCVSSTMNRQNDFPN